MGKGETARYEQFLFCPQCFQNSGTAGVKTIPFGGWGGEGLKTIISPRSVVCYNASKISMMYRVDQN